MRGLFLEHGSSIWSNRQDALMKSQVCILDYSPPSGYRVLRSFLFHFTTFDFQAPPPLKNINASLMRQILGLVVTLKYKHRTYMAIYDLAIPLLNLFIDASKSEPTNSGNPYMR